MPKELPIFTVDAFTDQAFSGNPAAVCLNDDPKSLTNDQRQAIAAEMNITTAFVEPLQEGGQFNNANDFSLRWFTPKVEINLCGHATLATTAVLSSIIENPNHELNFKTMGGELKTKKQDNMIIMNFPQSSSKPIETNDIEDLLKFVYPLDKIQEVRHSPEMNDLLVVIKPTLSRAEFEALNPDISKIMSLSYKYRSLCVTMTVSEIKDTNGRPYDYLTRVFAPWIGINEDHVTGSSFTVTGPYWGGILSKKNLYVRQCSRRGGDVEVTLLDGGRMCLAGAATVTLKGTFFI